MSRRPSLPGAAELFRATGGGHAPAEPGRDAERPVPRLRPAEVDPPAERTASVTPLAPGGPARVLDDGAPVPMPTAGVQRPGDPAPPVVPVAPLSRPASGNTAVYDDPAGRRPSSNGVRQTRRQRTRSVADRMPSGRERHEEKITVYCSAEELFDLETARLNLRGQHGLVVDRGRIVREAVGIILADLEAKGDDSILVRRLRQT